MTSGAIKSVTLILATGLILIGVALTYLLALNFFPGQTQVMPGFSEVLLAVGGVIVLGAFWLRNHKANE